MTDLYNFPAGPFHNEKAYDLALRRLFNNAESALQGNLLQDFVQFGQLGRLVGDTAGRLGGALGSLRRHDFGGAIKSLWSPQQRVLFRQGGGLSNSKSLANNWLELQYGWKPLLQDVHDAAEALAKYVTGQPGIWQVKASATLEDQDSGDVGLFEWPSIPGGKYNTTSRTTVRLGMRYTIDDALRSFMAQTGFTNPLSLAWEVLPFSFVIDWFLPIGNYLNTLTAWDGLRFLDGYTTHFTRQNTSVYIAWSGNPLNDGSDFSEQHVGYMDREWISLNRQRIDSFPGGRFPQLKNPLSLVHSLNALALLKSNWHT